jgi:hypothetical protein
MKAAGPAPVTVAAFGIQRTMAMKIATISKELRTFGRMPPAIRSDRRMEFLGSIVDIAYELLHHLHKKRY